MCRSIYSFEIFTSLSRGRSEVVPRQSPIFLQWNLCGCPYLRMDFKNKVSFEIDLMFVWWIIGDSLFLRDIYWWWIMTLSIVFVFFQWIVIFIRFILFLSVRFFKVFKYLLLSNSLLAAFTDQVWPASMSLQMFLLVRYLVEYKVTSVHRALKWLLSCVDSEMIEKIMPFSEYFSTVGIIAGKNIWAPSCLRI